jgi:cyclase
MAGDYRHFTLEPLAEGAWAALHRIAPPAPDAWAISNAGIVDLGDRTLVFDAFMTGAAAAELRSAAEAVTGRPPEVVVLSHAHNDHAWGLGRFPEATVVSSARARSWLEAEGAAEVEEYREAAEERVAFWLAAALGDDPAAREGAAFSLPYWQGVAATLPTLRLRLPDLAIECRLEIHGSDRRVEIVTVDRAHTDGDLVLLVPDQRLAFCGDLLFVGCHPYLGDGSLGGLRRALSLLEACGADRFVPGHGPVGWAGDVAALGSYLDDVERLAATGETAMPDAYRTWGLPGFFAANVAFAGAAATTDRG